MKHTEVSFVQFGFVSQNKQQRQQQRCQQHQQHRRVQQQLQRDLQPKQLLPLAQRRQLLPRDATNGRDTTTTTQTNLNSANQTVAGQANSKLGTSAVPTDSASTLSAGEQIVYTR